MYSGEIEYVKLTPEDVEEAVDALNISFFVNESVCRASEINIPKNPDSIQARKDLSELCRIVAKDGVSLVAKHIPSNKIVGVAFNKVQVSFAKNLKACNLDHCYRYSLSTQKKINLFLKNSVIIAVYQLIPNV